MHSPEGKKESAPHTDALVCILSFDSLIPQQGAAGAVGRNGNGKRKKEVPKGEQKLSLGASTDITWSQGTTNGTN